MKFPPIRHSSAVVRIIGASSIVALIHFVVWRALFAAAFRAIDAGKSFPVLLGLVLNVLGAPLMFLLYIPTSTSGASTTWWGDDSNFIIGLAVPNSLLWGFVVVWVYCFVRRHRGTRSDTA
jgi:hypothetical protein